ncbi:hypothetical protein HMPREF1624_03983 [Sporothrix schenckii ATCC 58251]|uniref:MARVEL domain-containing protein n=2 Tax=Sporothrix schenckii TaxID=29908 RepID=U7PT21_SPOS1|nr:hypothetical protein HMPREF1624_03983 [Sporothrix schenckii ATCC 58251]
MASTTTMSESIDVERRYDYHAARGHRHATRIHKYRWPAVQLNFWIVIMLAAACTWIGIFATLVQTQQRLVLHVPWYFAYILTVASLGVTFVLAILGLIFQRRLLPSIVMIGAFMMFVLWVVALVVLSIELFGDSGAGVATNCNLSVFNQNPIGLSTSTLAWMQQKSICQSWQAAFAFGLVGAIFLFWIMVMAYQVFADDV